MGRPEVLDYFAKLIQRVAPKSYAQAIGEVKVCQKFLENFGGDQVCSCMEVLMITIIAYGCIEASIVVATPCYCCCCCRNYYFAGVRVNIVDSLGYSYHLLDRFGS